jgi:uncharacterized membrane protein YhhN
MLRPDFLRTFYWLLLAANIVSNYYGPFWWQAATKALLMPVLFGWLILAKKFKIDKNWKLIAIGLATAWAGDVSLLFTSRHATFFIVGLLCFLATHLFYIWYYFRYTYTSQVSLIRLSPVSSIFVILFSLLFFAYLLPYLGNMTLPVAVYTIVITFMLLKALSIVQTVAPRIASIFIAGSALFVLSDSVLALNKFSNSFSLASAVIMITYGCAQWLIVKGATENTDDKMPDRNEVID